MRTAAGAQLFRSFDRLVLSREHVACPLGVSSPNRVVAFFATLNVRSEEHTSELQSHRDLPSFPTRRSSDLFRSFDRLVLSREHVACPLGVSSPNRVVAFFATLNV